MKVISKIKNWTHDEFEKLFIALGVKDEDIEKAVKKIEKETVKGMTPDEQLARALNLNLESMKLSKRVFKNVNLSNDREYIRSLVASYYMVQDDRIAAAGQARSVAARKDEKNEVLEYFASQLEMAEKNISTFLDVWTDNYPVAAWAKAQCGIGEVLAAGVVAWFDISKAKSAGAFWRYAGIAEGGANRTCRKKGQKVNYSPKAKTLAWKCGHSFIVQSSRKGCYYGKIYQEIKDRYTEKNEAGGFAENAKLELSMKKYDDTTKSGQAYLSGKLPEAHIDAMALRYAAKIFLSHLFDVSYMYEYGEMPPKPYAITHMGHVDIIRPQKLEIILPHLQKKFPDKDWCQMIKTHYHMDISAAMSEDSSEETVSIIRKITNAIRGK